jgi:hypothetical protein
MSEELNNKETQLKILSSLDKLTIDQKKDLFEKTYKSMLVEYCQLKWKTNDIPPDTDGRIIRGVKTKCKILTSLEFNLGNITNTMNELNIERVTHYKHLEADPIYAKMVKSVEYAIIDFVESKLLEKINEGSERSIIFFLQNRAKSRGYGNTIDITQTTNNIETIRIIEVSDKKESGEKGDE